jgi:hypothetical protein
MKTKHTATDSKGKVHKRTSANRVYSHCVVIHLRAIPPRENSRGWDARSCAEWASTRALAEKNAANWRRKDVEAVEIVEAEITKGK